MVKMSRLFNKVAVVTGAFKGIGAGIATALGAAGARVTVNYSSDRQGAERLVKPILRMKRTHARCGRPIGNAYSPDRRARGIRRTSTRRATENRRKGAAY